jgi:hypothetical protein
MHKLYMYIYIYRYTYMYKYYIYIYIYIYIYTLIYIYIYIYITGGWEWTVMRRLGLVDSRAGIPGFSCTFTLRVCVMSSMCVYTYVYICVPDFSIQPTAYSLAGGRARALSFSEHTHTHSLSLSLSLANFARALSLSPINVDKSNMYVFLRIHA